MTEIAVVLDDGSEVNITSGLSPQEVREMTDPEFREFVQSHQEAAG